MTNPSIAVVFDLDDTLYKEIDFLKSAFSSIAHSISLEVPIDKKTIFEKMVDLYNSEQNTFEGILRIYKSTFTIEKLLAVYRNHKPNIQLSSDIVAVLDLLKKKKIPLGLLTDGRSVQQRNKIEALKLEEYFSEIIISEEFGSEKPSLANYTYFEKKFSAKKYFYIGDNEKKDFITPNNLDWKTIKLIDNGLNIHKNKEASFKENYLADYSIHSLSEICPLIIK